jgi:cellulose synthase/poly-beta-1,6-N-acetylglucosamine synthase-like glycosyltransferase
MMIPLKNTHGENRVWEIIPGALVWTTFLSALVLSFVAPVFVVMFVIVFDLYWLFRVAYFVFFLIVSWRRYRRCVRQNWAKDLRALPGWDRIHHLVFLPTYKEELEIIRATFRSLAASEYPKDKMIVVLAGEERDHEQFQKNARAIEQEFGRTFRRMIVTEHPQGLSEEIPGKGSNLHFAGNAVKEVLETEFPNVPAEDIIASAFDVDTVAHPQYFAHLSATYLSTPDRTHASYQPVALLANNIWTATAPVRIAAFGTTFWLMGELSRPERLWTFSSHSMPWKMLLDVGFWQKDIVSEDSRIFLQGLLRYHGNYRVVPLFLPVSMDTVTGKNYLESLWALYRQQRRWAWGVEHFPFMVSAFRKDPLIPRHIKIKYLWNHIEGMYTWATAPVLIFFFGRLPLYLARESDAALVQAAPFTLEWIMRLAMLGVFASAVLAMTILPARPASVRPHTWLVMLLQWFLLPITFTVFGALPAIDAQTRLMFGRYLGFQVTRKSRRFERAPL